MLRPSKKRYLKTPTGYGFQGVYRAWTRESAAERVG